MLAFGRIAAAGGTLWLCLGTAPANAEGRETATRLQTGVGTMPLVAAIGIGILIAVIAVIAFLQMTTRARNGAEPAEAGDDAELAAEPAVFETVAAEPSAEEDDTAAELEEPLPDYTLPLPTLRLRPEPALPASEGVPRLWGLEGEFAGTAFKVSSCWLTIGRDAAQCGLIFPYDAGEVSRKHCSLKFEEDRGLFLLEDHHSSNGTFLSGGERLAPGIVYELAPGSRFALSGERHWFEVQV